MVLFSVADFRPRSRVLIAWSMWPCAFEVGQGLVERRRGWCFFQAVLEDLSRCVRPRLSRGGLGHFQVNLGLALSHSSAF